MPAFATMSIPALIFAKDRNTMVNAAVMINGEIADNMFRLFGRNLRKSREFVTTETELKAMARPANSGFSTIPNATNARAAMGMPMML